MKQFAMLTLLLVGTAHAQNKPDEGTIILVCDGTMQTIQKSGVPPPRFSEWKETITINLKDGFVKDPSGVSPIVWSDDANIAWRSRTSTGDFGLFDRVSGYLHAETDFGAPPNNLPYRLIYDATCTRKIPSSDGELSESNLPNNTNTVSATIPVLPLPEGVALSLYMRTACAFARQWWCGLLIAPLRMSGSEGAPTA